MTQAWARTRSARLTPQEMGHATEPVWAPLEGFLFAGSVRKSRFITTQKGTQDDFIGKRAVPSQRFTVPYSSTHLENHMKASIKTGLSITAAALFATAGVTTSAQSAIVDLTVTVHNLAPANSVVVAPLSVGFGQGVFDGFDIGGVANASIVKAAELGNGNLWRDAFTGTDASAVVGVVGGAPLAAGLSATQTFRVDTSMNSYFSFIAMVVPSNDFFIGNDFATAFKLFDGAGNLQITSIGQKARDIWDAGSEEFNVANAAFIVGSNAGARDAQNSVVARNFGEFAAYNGLTTAYGYAFNSGLSGSSDVYRIDFSAQPVPEPQTYALMLAGLAAMGAMVRRRRSAA